MRIGNEEFKFIAESKKALDIEITLLNIMVYTLVFTYAFELLSWPIFYLLFHFFYISFFMASHDRFHADSSRHLPRPLEFVAEHFALIVVPWAEPYDSIRKKHFIHHMSHNPNKTPAFDPLGDPHSIYEAGGFWRSLFYAAFFEEAQLLIDIRNKQITRERWTRFIIYLPLQILFIMYFGWEKFLFVLLAVRMSSSIGWFVFSWFEHTYLYSFGLANKIPWPIKLFLGLTNGKRVYDGIFYHAAHHVWPQVPPKQLGIVDSAVMRNPEIQPAIIATRNMLASR